MQCCLFKFIVRHYLVPVTYIKGGELIIDIQNLLDGVAHSTDDPINDVHHTVGGHLITVDDPGAIHRHNLHREEFFCRQFG